MVGVPEGEKVWGYV